MLAKRNDLLCACTFLSTWGDLLLHFWSWNLCSRIWAFLTGTTFPSSPFKTEDGDALKYIIDPNYIQFQKMIEHCTIRRFVMWRFRRHFSTDSLHTGWFLMYDKSPGNFKYCSSTIPRLRYSNHGQPVVVFEKLRKHVHFRV